MREMPKMSVSYTENGRGQKFRRALRTIYTLPLPNRTTFNYVATGLCHHH